MNKWIINTSKKIIYILYIIHIYIIYLLYLKLKIKYLKQV